MVDIFCNVIDNFGDAGFSLRLARSLINKGIVVTLYCDNLTTLQKLVTHKDTNNPLLKFSSWPEVQNYDPADYVIEAFSCHLPPALITKIKIKDAIVIELDYLTAEKFAEDCHGLSSSTDGLKSFFFFPGFTHKTGGVIFDDVFKHKVQKALKKKHTNNSPLNISLFSYENPKIKFIFNNLMQSTNTFDIRVFEGKALDNINVLYPSLHIEVGKNVVINNLKIKGTTMSDQNIYDRILLSSDLNLVRGEESAVRAMLCGKPFLWHIYPQEGNFHIVKLNALFDRMLEYIPFKYQKYIEIIRNFNLEYNGINTNTNLPLIEDFLPIWAEITALWSAHIFSLGSLTDNLLSFLQSKTNNLCRTNSVKNI